MTNINTYKSEQRLDELAFRYACGSLSEQELDQVEQNFMQMLKFQTRLAYWERYIAELDHSLEAVPAPPAVWQNINQHLLTQQRGQNSSSQSLAQRLSQMLKEFWLGVNGATLGLSASAMLIVLVIFFIQPKNPVYLDDQWLVRSNINSSVITLVAIAPDPISADINCNLWITNSDGALFVATLPETGEVTVDLSAYPEVLKKLNRPGLLQVTFDQKGTQPERMGAVMVEASWSI